MSTLGFGLGVMGCDMGADMINGLQYIKSSIYTVHESRSDSTQGRGEFAACILYAVFALINQALVDNLCLKLRNLLLDLSVRAAFIFTST